MSSGVELALGTVQFGMEYGIAGRGDRTSPAEAREVLALAWRAGVRLLDTAPAYGGVEARLADLVGDCGFEVVSKIPALPSNLTNAAAGAFVQAAIRRSRERLGARLRTMLFHSASDLNGPLGAAIWQAAVEAVRDSGIVLGASCYSPREAAELTSTFPVQVVQLPGNAFDQRLRAQGLSSRIELHLRSVFLQGLLLLDEERVATRMPKALPAMQRWRLWYEKHGLSPLRAALSIAKALPGARYCVVGVESAEQLGQVLSAWNSAEPIEALSLATEDAAIIDPRCW